MKRAVAKPPRVDVIVPFGYAPEHPERQENLAKVVADLVTELEYEDFRVFVAELGPNPTQAVAARNAGATHIFHRTDAVFSPGRAMNIGFLGRSDPAELVYFHQADFLVPAGVLRRSVEMMERLDCPFVYPYWGEVHLSAPVSATVRGGALPAGELVSAFGRCAARWRADAKGTQARTDGFDECALDEVEAAGIAALLPERLSEHIAASSYKALWGTDDRAYAPYRWEPSAAGAARMCRVSGGPRASAAYLCRDAAFRTIGGVPELIGWGFEDLIMWELVQAFHPYEGDRGAIRFAGSEITMDYPLVHLWHPIRGRADYYSHTEDNERTYREFQALTAGEKRQRARALPAVSGGGSDG